MITETIFYLNRKLVNEIKDVFFLLSRAWDKFKIFHFSRSIYWHDAFNIAQVIMGSSSFPLRISFLLKCQWQGEKMVYFLILP